MKKQTKADKAFVAKIQSVTFSFGSDAALKGGCPLCGKVGACLHPITITVKRVANSDENSFAA